MLNEMLKLNILIMAKFFCTQIIYCTKYFPRIITSFNPHNNPDRQVLLLSPFIDDETKIQRR